MKLDVVKSKKRNKGSSPLLCTYYLNRLFSNDAQNGKVMCPMKSGSNLHLPNSPCFYHKILWDIMAFVCELQFVCVWQGGGIVLKCNFTGELINGSHRRGEILAFI